MIGSNRHAERLPAAYDECMQRLFSMFPAGRPGVALLMMRVALAVMLVDGVWDHLNPDASWFLAAPGSLALALCLGFLVPIVCALSVLLEVTTWATSANQIEAVHVCAVLDASALLMLGPGAYSLDARLFGRRRVVLASGRRRSRD